MGAQHVYLATGMMQANERKDAGSFLLIAMQAKRLYWKIYSTVEECLLAL
jgi:hypothetical protein